MTTRNDHWQRLLAVGLLLIPPALVYFGLIAPYLERLSENRERIEDLRFQLQRLQRTAAQLPQWRQRLQALRASQASQLHYLQGATPALAAAALQNRLGEIVRAAGGEILSAQTLPSKTEDTFIRIAVRLRFTASTDSLRQILHTIEGQTPLLSIESLRMRPLRGRRNPKTRRFETVDNLNVDMQVVGYLQAPKAS